MCTCYVDDQTPVKCRVLAQFEFKHCFYYKTDYAFVCENTNS